MARSVGGVWDREAKSSGSCEREREISDEREIRYRERERERERAYNVPLSPRSTLFTKACVS